MRSMGVDREEDRERDGSKDSPSLQDRGWEEMRGYESSSDTAPDEGCEDSKV